MSKSVIMANPEMLERAKTAMLYPVTGQDRCRIRQQWFPVDAVWRLERQVEEVQHFGRHFMAVGDQVALKRIEGDVLAHVLIEMIVMKHAAELTENDAHALGYDSVDAFAADWGQVYSGRVWWMVFKRFMQGEV